MDIQNRLLTGNQEFVDGADKGLVKKLVEGQKPYALIVTCSDSRVIPEKIFSCNLGELFVIRTAGNVINEGELASIEYGVEHLGIQYVLILGHTHCGAIRAALRNDKGRFISCITKNISKNIQGEKDEIQAAKINAINQAIYLKDKFPNYCGEIKAGLYDIENGQVSILDDQLDQQNQFINIGFNEI